MSQIQNYQVEYKIIVDATEGTNQVRDFARSVESLLLAKNKIGPVAGNIRDMMNDIDKAFRTNGGKKRDYSFKVSIDTASSEEKLGRVKALLGEIKTMAEGIRVAINPGEPLKTRQIKANAKELYNRKAVDARDAEIKKTAESSVKSMMDTQKLITKSIGKVNSAMISLENGRRLNIQTDVAKKRLEEILGLMNRIRGASKITLGVQTAKPGAVAGRNGVPFVPSYILPQSAQDKLHSNQQSAKHIEQLRSEIAKLKNNQASRTASREISANNALNNSRQRAAINRLQYSRTPSMRRLPFVSMFNGYMAYGLMRSQLTEAIEYGNIMESARSILRVADSDLSTFETRFANMSQNVRQIGIDTKFTAAEIASAAKFLAMAGMDIDTINKSMRPITNLALIGDNDVGLIADLTTNIMSGYNIRGESMNTVADIIASTISRSNVNIVTTAESYKMAAGYLKMAGVDFSESAAAIGILGNSGIKGTMAGTALRSMSQRFAKPTKEGRGTLDKLGVKFTEFEDVFGKQVEKLRPLADIFDDLKKKGASMADMQAIFGRIGGNAAMMFLNNSDKLRTLAAQNRASHGISTELALVKQNTTKGLWAQVTSQLTESFMKGYEIIEPVIKSSMRSFLEKFKAPELARGIASIGRALVGLFSLLGNIATWFARNYTWLEPVLFTGFAAIKLFKLAGAVTNLGIALGFLGRQSVGSSALQMIGGLAGMKGAGSAVLSFANKRAIVTALQAAGVSGRGQMTQALLGAGIGAAGRGAAGSMLSTQVAMGSGLVGAGASISALGAGAIAATGGIALLVGALGYAAYKTWQLKKAKDAMQEEISSKEKYRYPSIEALYESLNKTYNMAKSTKKEVDELTSTKTVEEASGQSSGWFTGNWWKAFLTIGAQIGAGSYHGHHFNDPPPVYTFKQATQDDIRASIITLARRDSQARVNSAVAEVAKMTDANQIGGFIDQIQNRYGIPAPQKDKNLWTEQNGVITYNKNFTDLLETNAAKTPDYANFINNTTVKHIEVLAEGYRRAMVSASSAQYLMERTGFSFAELKEKGFSFVNGRWVQKALGKNATDEERRGQYSNRQYIHDTLVRTLSTIRSDMGGSAEMAENIVRKAGFTTSLYSNEPDFKDTDPFNANRITNDPDDDDGGAGGNYSGTGKLSSAAPKQVIVNITNLLSVQTIDLMKSPEGKREEIQNLKEQMAQALIDVVHDFDASWNG